MDNSFEKLINRVLDGRYKVENVLGIGGMAYVLKATDLKENRVVAIKILNEESNGDERAVKRFINESEAIKLVSSPNIVKIYDIAISDTLKYIVMEYIDGITLKDYIDKVGALGWKEAVHYVKQILSGLSDAHEKDIVHRDIKPQNIMLLKDGHVKVTDFGIAKMPTSEPITMTDKAIGTVNYISPEQASGTKVNFKTDLYSVGVMFYEMVTGQLPFKAESPVAVAMMQVSNDPVPPREINPSVPVGLEQIILKAMSKDPEARFSSAGAMKKALDYFAKNPTVVFAQPDSTGVATRNRPIDVSSLADKKESKKSRPMYPIILGITLAFFTVAAAVGIYAWKSSDGNWFDMFNKVLGYENTKDSDVIVDDYVGKTYDEALAKEIFDAGYEVELRYLENSSKKSGVIISQNPSANDVRKKPKDGEKIPLTLYVNQLNVETKMIDCKTSREDTAISALENFFNSSLPESNYDPSNIIVEERFSENVPKGYVIDTLPAADTTIIVKPDLRVILYVSKGVEKQEVIMPAVVGKTRKEAERLIEGNDLFIGDIMNEHSEKYAAGFVIRASVEAGETVDNITPIDLWISLGKEESQDTSGNETNEGPSQNGDNGNSDAQETTPPEQNTEPSGDSTDNGGLDALLGLRGEGGEQ